MRYSAILSANETLFQLLKLGLAVILCFDPGVELLPAKSRLTSGRVSECVCPGVTTFHKRVLSANRRAW